MLKIHGFTGEGHAKVDTEGLFRVVIQQSGEIVEEFVTAEEAETAVEFWKECGGGFTVEAVSYESLAPPLAAI